MNAMTASFVGQTRELLFDWVDKCLPDIPLTGNLVSKELVDNTK